MGGWWCGGGCCERLPQGLKMLLRLAKNGMCVIELMRATNQPSNRTCKPRAFRNPAYLVVQNFQPMNNLTHFLQQQGFKDETLGQIAQCFTRKNYQKGEYFLEEGKTSRHLAFIESGLFQYYVLMEGEEKSTYVATENSFLASLVSFLNQCPSREYIRCIADADVWMLHKTALEKLLAEAPGFKDFYIRLLEYQICCIDNSRFDFIMLSAEERYKKMLHKEPHLLQSIPLQYLASVLGVTPRHLSRIRKNIR